MSAGQISLSYAVVEQELTRFKSYYRRWLEEVRNQPVVNSNLKELVASFVEPELATLGQGLAQTVNEFMQRVVPGLANTAGPRAFSWVVGGVTPAAFIAMLYQAIYDQINMVSGTSLGPKLESETVKLLLDLFTLPRNEFMGTLTTGATASNLCAIACARQWWGECYGVNIAGDGAYGLPRMEVYAASPHASVSKALSIIGLGRQSLIIVDTLAEREAVDVENLRQRLSQSQATAKVFIASAGTVNSGDFDNLEEVAHICAVHNTWLHIDGAFGLFARCNKRYAHLAAYAQLADSITVDGHKWLNVPYECGILFLKNSRKRYLTTTFSSVADYMSLAADEPMNMGIENSRALRALPVWMTLKAYGKDGYSELIARNCEFAYQVGEYIRTSQPYRLLTPVYLNIVLFCAPIIEAEPQNKQLLDCINAIGNIFITPTLFQGKPALRIAVSNWRTTLNDDFAAVTEALRQGFAAYMSTYLCN